MANEWDLDRSEFSRIQGRDSVKADASVQISTPPILATDKVRNSRRRMKRENSIFCRGLRCSGLAPSCREKRISSQLGRATGYLQERRRELP